MRYIPSVIAKESMLLESESNEANCLHHGCLPVKKNRTIYVLTTMYVVTCLSAFT